MITWIQGSPRYESSSPAFYGTTAHVTVFAVAAVMKVNAPIVPIPQICTRAGLIRSRGLGFASPGPVEGLTLTVAVAGRTQFRYVWAWLIIPRDPAKPAARIGADEVEASEPAPKGTHSSAKGQARFRSRRSIPPHTR